MDLEIQIQILNDAVSISQYANALGKGMNLSLFTSAMGR